MLYKTSLIIHYANLLFQNILLSLYLLFEVVNISASNGK